MSHLRKSGRLRRLFVPLVVMVSMFAMTATSAQALTQYKYFSGLLQPNTWAKGPGPYNTTSLMGNVATYEGKGQISVCQKVFVLGFGYPVNSCGLNGAGNALNAQAYMGNLQEPMVKNNSAFAHTINGYAYLP